MTCLLLPVGPWCTNSIDTVWLHVDIGRLNTLMILVWIAATSRFTLGELGIESCWLVGLIHRHTFHRLATVIPFRIVPLILSSHLINYDFLAICWGLWWLHRVHAGSVMLGTDLAAHQLLLHICLYWLLSLEALLSATLKVLADM